MKKLEKLAILYVCTGKYTTFWKKFYQSSEELFLKDICELHYFVFTDSDKIEYSDNPRVHRIFQEGMSWPYPTLYRFKIFQGARAFLEKMDFIYFFNANMLFLEPVNEEILPDAKHDLVFVQHPLMSLKKPNEFTYERNPLSLAYIPYGQGKTYVMGGLNGGKASAYLRMIDILESRITSDENNGIVAIWHDESHLNRYALENMSQIKVMDPSYGFAEGKTLPFEKRILIRNKNKYGGADFLRNVDENSLKGKFTLWLSKRVKFKKTV